MSRIAALMLLAAGALVVGAAGAAIDDQITIGNTRVIVRTVIGNFEGDLRILQLEDDVYHNELIETEAESATQLVFLDETTLTLGPNSRVVLDSFVFDPDPSKAAFVMTATKGIFRFASGKLPKNAYRLHTPAATIGIRGTVLTFSVAPAEGERGEAVVRIALEEGEASVDDCRGGSLVLAAGQSLELVRDPAEPCTTLMPIPRRPDPRGSAWRAGSAGRPRPEDGCRASSARRIGCLPAQGRPGA